MKIVKALFVPGSSAFYFDDKRAIKAGAGHDGFFYTGQPATPHFKSVRVAGEILSILLVLENGAVAGGIAPRFRYSEPGGRDPLFLAADSHPCSRDAHPAGARRAGDQPFGRWRGGRASWNSTACGSMPPSATDCPKPSSEARAFDRHRLTWPRSSANTISRSSRRVPVFGQTGDDRFINADKMILKAWTSCPRPDQQRRRKLGRNGEAPLPERTSAGWPTGSRVPDRTLLPSGHP